eukprot:6191981-Pleurochrysis_carterae.AAC.11
MLTFTRAVVAWEPALGVSARVFGGAGGCDDGEAGDRDGEAQAADAQGARRAREARRPAQAFARGDRAGAGEDRTRGEQHARRARRARRAGTDACRASREACRARKEKHASRSRSDAWYALSRLFVSRSFCSLRSKRRVGSEPCCDRQRHVKACSQRRAQVGAAMSESGDAIALPASPYFATDGVCQ